MGGWGVRIQITKRADGAGILRCTRDDGTVTWQKQQRHAAHFALHDLTHYTVETILGSTHGFFGLVNAGWEIDDTTGKGARGPIPREAAEIESLVGLLDSERASGSAWTLQEFQEFGSPAAHRLTEDIISAMRQRRAHLFTQWAAVPPGGTLELQFPYSAR